MAGQGLRLAERRRAAREEEYGKNDRLRTFGLSRGSLEIVNKMVKSD